MDKYAVVTGEETAKTASKRGDTCPGCGGVNVNYHGNTPHCPQCGTKPWERRQSGKK